MASEVAQVNESQLNLVRRPKRETEFSKLLPVIFVVFVIITLWAVYLFCHLLPLWGILGNYDKERSTGDKTRAMIECIVFHILLAMLLCNYVLAVVTDAGQVPDTPQWTVTQDAEAGPVDMSGIEVFEKKRTGERRHCKWCQKYKPDRCHHCRVCKQCVLKMDHHCPWIYNCVGYKNHKYFFLLLFYAVLTCNFICWTMIESTAEALNKGFDKNLPGHTFKIFCLLFGETFSGFLVVLLTAFFGFHIWLAFNGMTTIEFCEKSLNDPGEGRYKSRWDRGCYGNAKAVMGRRALFWLCPFGGPDGDGLRWHRKKLPGDTGELSDSYDSTSSSEDSKKSSSGEKPKETMEEERQRLLAESGAYESTTGSTPVMAH